MDRSELLNHVREARTKLDGAIGRFGKNQLTEPILPNAWSVKDVIAHIGFWEGRVAWLYEILVAGNEPEETFTAETVDALNAKVFSDNQLLPLGIVQLNEKEAYEAILILIENAPEADLFDPGRFAWSRGEPFYRWIAVNTYEHYNDHLPDLLAAEKGGP
jgi:hypothetical protein